MSDHDLSNDHGRKVGKVTEAGNADRRTIAVAVSYEFVCITISGRGAGPRTVALSPAEAAEFGRLFATARREARQMASETADA